MSIRETFTGLFKRTTTTAEGASFAVEQLCRCSPAWPGLETTANGYVLPAEASSHYSILTNPDTGPFVARCTGCQARYPHPWVIPQGAPMPFDWAQE
ncbi:hypothetical protein Save01_09073 [Streptomyces avermitilis]|uniref:Uncharacterized protein n=1 Tax=Streptomyces avermitilis TaxID=33903 RepID=A0A4D4MG32_STRAX|nr:hypothetical protein SAV14893_080160 [Streptomyces avermitilis]GDY71002.1 hypothetical protein SAV31267_004870 [Streptomyces avermitilis]